MAYKTMNYEYCYTKFANKSILNNHKNKAKYCLVIQGKINDKEQIFKCEYCNKVLSSKQYLKEHNKKCEKVQEKVEIIFKCDYCFKVLSSKQNLGIHVKKCEKVKEKVEIIFNCEYCNKGLSSKQMLKNHKNICNIKKQKEDIELKQLKEKLEINKILEKELKNKLEMSEKELKEKEKIIIKIKTQNENYKEQNLSYKEQVKDLQDKLDKIANKAIDKPTNSTTHNTLNFKSSIDFNDIDKIKNVIQNSLNINHIVDGQKGIANFVKDTLLTDDTGQLLYICTDPSRYVFKYKDSTGAMSYHSK